MNVVPMDQADPIKPGIYFITAESVDFNSALNAVQNGINSPNFAGTVFMQLVFSQKIQKNLLTAQPEIMYVVCAVIKIEEDRSN